jgi:hypothetical protein
MFQSPSKPCHRPKVRRDNRSRFGERTATGKITIGHLQRHMSGICQRFSEHRLFSSNEPGGNWLMMTER